MRVLRKLYRQIRSSGTAYMSPEETAYFRSQIGPDDVVLEWGAGGSTLFFSKMVARYYSIEHSKKWFEKISKHVPNNVAIFYIPQTGSYPDRPAFEKLGDGNYEDFKEYAHGFERIPETPTVYFIDGRVRVECARLIIPKISLTTKVFVHDYNRYKKNLSVWYQEEKVVGNLALLRLKARKHEDKEKAMAGQETLKDKPLISVILPVFQQWGLLAVCLESLFGQSFPSEKMEILIISNEAEGEPPDWIKNETRVRVLFEPKPGSYAARNAGVRAAKGDILAFTDADCIPAKDWIQRAVKTFNERPEIPRLAGRIELYFRQPHKRSAVELFEDIFAFQQERKVKTEGSAITANMFTRRQVFDAIGLFNEALKSGGDTDWGKRAAFAGFPILYVADLRVSHPARYTLGQLHKKTVRLYGGKWLQARHEFKGRPPFSKMFSFLPPKMTTFKTAFGTSKVQTPYQLFQVAMLVAFVAAIQVIEYIRLRFGGSPTRD